MNSFNVPMNANLPPDQQEAALAEADGIIDSSMDSQVIVHGYHHKRMRPLSKNMYLAMQRIWQLLPVGTRGAELEAWVLRKMAATGTSNEDLALFEQLRVMMRAMPEELDWKHASVYLEVRVQGGKVRLSEAQRALIGNDRYRIVTKHDEWTTFGKMGGSIAQQATAMGLLESHGSPPPSSWAATSKCVMFAQDLAVDVHTGSKAWATLESAGQFMRRYRDAVESGQETTVMNSYAALGQGDPPAAEEPERRRTPVRRALDTAGEYLVRPFRLFSGGDNEG